MSKLQLMKWQLHYIRTPIISPCISELTMKLDTSALINTSECNI